MNYIQNQLNHFLVSSAPVPDFHNWNEDKTTFPTIVYYFLFNHSTFSLSGFYYSVSKCNSQMFLINNRAKTIVLLKHSPFIFCIGKLTTYIVWGRQDVELPFENVPRLHLRHTVSWDAVPVSINIALLKPNQCSCMRKHIWYIGKFAGSSSTQPCYSSITFILTCLCTLEIQSSRESTIWISLPDCPNPEH